MDAKTADKVRVVVPLSASLKLLSTVASKKVRPYVDAFSFETNVSSLVLGAVIMAKSWMWFNVLSGLLK